jgi:2-oxoglutarate dehydrogenase E1 component
MEGILYGDNAAYLSDLYQEYIRNPEGVDPKWQRVFRDMGPIASGGQVDERTTIDSIRALMLIRAYRVRGHLAANLDPLGIEKRETHLELEPSYYGFGPADLDRLIYIDNVLGFERASLKAILDRLRKTYCNTIGVEFMHIQDPVQKAWIQERIENSIKPKIDPKKILTELTQAEFFEKFLNTKFPGAKRFGLEGGESLIPGIEQVLNIYQTYGVQEICLGMAHRGRLSVLANIMRQPIKYILALFQGQSLNPDSYEGSGDVKYHLGYSSDRIFNGAEVHLSLNANPSHLEAVDPVVLGKVRSKQDQRNDIERQKVAGVLLHGDAAFAGQGLVAETLSLCGLDGYETGGTLHFIINNQIGFTTSPPHSRSSPYSSDIAKAIQAPIFHVNADYPEDVVWVSSLAAEFVRTFGVDAVIDMICYRRYGHNEMDEPAFTQPIMYKAIAKHPTTRALYAKYVQDAELLSAKEVLSIEKKVQSFLNSEFELASTLNGSEKKLDWLEGAWSKVKDKKGKAETGVPIEQLKKLGKTLCTLPNGFAINPKLKRQLDQRAQALQDDGPLDWATGEALAFATLLSEGKTVRLSGQDSCRGTFSHRHAVIIDQENEDRYIPLNNLNVEQATFEVIDSPLAEASVLGFDYGYSTANPDALVIWEAQFGDFANGAQVIIDQFISSAEKKWLRLSGLVMLLPHGMEGQGPEHSSARLERYLQLCAEDNMQVVNCTTPANFYHVLRRQLHSEWRKPLIVMTPKSLLRHKSAVSYLKDMGENTYFKRLITDDMVKKSSRVVLCSGKVYYDLLEAREAKKNDQVAILRLEQYYPFPEGSLTEALKSYGDVPLVWCQEEPCNMGAWGFLDRRLESVLKKLKNTHNRPYCVGRKEAASPATGIAGRHEKEQAAIIEAALFGPLQEL